MEIIVFDIDSFYKTNLMKVEQSVSILELKKKVKELQKLNQPLDELFILFDGKILEDNRTLADYNITELSSIFIRSGYCYNIIYEGIKYQKKGPGCHCCGGDIFGFMERETGIPKELFYIDNVPEKIESKDFNIQKTYLKEYIMKTKENMKKIKIKKDDHEFYVYYCEPLNYDKLYELIIERFFAKIGFGKPPPHLKEKWKSKTNLIFGDRIIDENEDLNKLENLNELTLIRKKKI